eukprot:2735608-Rhodomonas_salina.2
MVCGVWDEVSVCGCVPSGVRCAVLRERTARRCVVLKCARGTARAYDAVPCAVLSERMAYHARY